MLILGVRGRSELEFTTVGTVCEALPGCVVGWETVIEGVAMVAESIVALPGSLGCYFW